MANPTTESEKRFEIYLDAHGYVGEHDIDWRRRFEVDTPRNPDFLVSRALEELAICEVKEWMSSPVDRRLSEQRVASFSSEEVFGTAADAVQAAALEQLRPFKDVGLPLVAVLANPYHRVVPLGADDMAKSLFGTTEVIQMSVPGPDIVRRVSKGTGALAAVNASGNLYNSHSYLSAVVVVHARENARDFVDREVAARRPTEPLRSPAARHAHAVSTLKALNAAKREGRVPDGEYEWVEVFDLSGLGAGSSGTPLPTNIFDGPRDRWYILDDHGFVERTASTGDVDNSGGADVSLGDNGPNAELSSQGRRSAWR
jgi:hypothetical protein